jgi:phosphoribosylaminoimidazole-succinocarboxamide synthase
MTSQADYTGKVRDVYDLGNNYYLLNASDRTSCFNRHVGIIPGKGKLLNQMSQFMFARTSHLVPNHMISSEGSCMLVKKCQPFKIEVVIRAYITGSLWKFYEKGGRCFCGVVFPDGLKRNQVLKEPIITPTTKDDMDEPISRDEIITTERMMPNELDIVYDYAHKLFDYGSKIAEKAGFILVDTKFEFGKTHDGRIILIDEVLTCDSSRYWIKNSYAERFNNGVEPEKFDKDCVRDWLLSAVNNVATDPIPAIPDNIRVATQQVYQSFYDRINSVTLDKTFKVVILSGSHKDAKHVTAITDACRVYELDCDTYIASAHKNTQYVLDLINNYDNNPNFSQVMYVTVAGRSNALSGVVAANSKYPVIACPPFNGMLDMMTNLHSTIQCPSNVPVMTILEPVNVALAIHKLVTSHV